MPALAAAASYPSKPLPKLIHYGITSPTLQPRNVNVNANIKTNLTLNIVASIRPSFGHGPRHKRLQHRLHLLVRLGPCR